MEKKSIGGFIGLRLPASQYSVKALDRAEERGKHNLNLGHETQVMDGAIIQGYLSDSEID